MILDTRNPCSKICEAAPVFYQVSQILINESLLFKAFDHTYQLPVAYREKMIIIA